MKKIACILCAAAAVLSLTACGNISSVRVNIGSSDIYSSSEISSAVDTVRNYFWKKFDGCTLTEVSYDESASQKAAAEWAESYDADQAIVLTSTFETGSSADGSLGPDSTYKNWQWILVRNGKGRWQLKTWGY